MKRRSYGVVGIVLVVFLVLAGTAGAQSGVNGSGWWSAVQVQRVGTAAGSAIVQMDAYARQGDAGGPWTCGSRPLAAFGSAATFFPHWVSDPGGSNCANVSGFPASYLGGAVLSSDDGLVAIAQTQNIRYGGFAPGDTPYGRAVAAYSGVNTPSTEIKFPVYKNNHSNEMTTFYIQNAGDADANLTATFKPCADQGDAGHTACLGFGQTYTYSFTGLGQGKTLVIDATMARAPGDVAIPAGNGSFGGLTVASTNGKLLAGVVLEHHKTASPALYLKSTSGFGTADYDTEIYAPALKYQYPGGPAASSPNASKWSSLVIHNADTVQVSVKITYTVAARNGSATDPAVGTKFSPAAILINPGESSFALFHQGLNAPAGSQARDLLSAQIKSTGGKVVAVVNEEGDYSIGGSSAERDKATYAARPKSAAALKLSFPAYKEQYNGKFGGVVVQNTTGFTAAYTATITVAGVSGSGVTAVAGNKAVVGLRTVVPAGGSATFYMTCRDFGNMYTNIGGAGTVNKSALCNSTTGNPTGGVNAALIVESNRLVVGLANEELLWYENAAARGDGHGEDASSYEGFPLN